MPACLLADLADVHNRTRELVAVQDAQKKKAGQAKALRAAARQKEKEDMRLLSSTTVEKLRGVAKLVCQQLPVVKLVGGNAVLYCSAKIGGNKMQMTKSNSVAWRRFPLLRSLQQGVSIQFDPAEQARVDRQSLTQRVGHAWEVRESVARRRAGGRKRACRGSSVDERAGGACQSRAKTWSKVV